MEVNQKNFKKCEICEVEATCLCMQCISYFCNECYKLIHDKKAKSGHKKEKIDYFIPMDTRCPEHPPNYMNLFCLEEKSKNFIIFII